MTEQAPAAGRRFENPEASCKPAVKCSVAMARRWQEVLLMKIVHVTLEVADMISDT